MTGMFGNSEHSNSGGEVADGRTAWCPIGRYGREIRHRKNPRL